VVFSPFEEFKIAVATADHFGIIGNGKQYVLDVNKDDNTIEKTSSYDTRKKKKKKLKKKNFRGWIIRLHLERRKRKLPLFGIRRRYDKNLGCEFDR